MNIEDIFKDLEKQIQRQNELLEEKSAIILSLIDIILEMQKREKNKFTQFTKLQK